MPSKSTGGIYQQEKNEKDEEDDAVEDERRDKGRDGAAGGLRAVGHRRHPSRRAIPITSNAEELGSKEGRERNWGQPANAVFMCVVGLCAQSQFIEPCLY
jgi:hypothetical protein